MPILTYVWSVRILQTSYNHSINTGQIYINGKFSLKKKILQTILLLVIGSVFFCELYFCSFAQTYFR